jgi:hypothetical protein
MANYDNTAAIVSFDAFSKIRILEAPKFEASEHLKEECKQFTESKRETFLSVLLHILAATHKRRAY